MRFLLAIIVLLAMPSLAFAHTGHTDTSSLLHGFAHPIGGTDHVLAMLAVGLFAYVLGGRALWLVPLSFVGMMVVGFALGLWQTALPFVEIGIAVSSIAIGLAAALNRPMPPIAAMVLVGAFAVFHGHAHGAEMPNATATLSYASGFVLATAVLHLTGIAAGFAAAKLVGSRAKLVTQGAATLVAIGGIGLLAGWL
jgi:urease accessory protein